MNSSEPYNVDIDIVVRQLGFPGEELETWLAEPGTNPVANPQGSPGQYRVEMILGRPNHLPEREIPDVLAVPFDGNSFIRLAKRKIERRPKDVHRLTLTTLIGNVALIPNDEGFAGKFVSDDFTAQSFGQAELMANAIITPLISGFSLYLDTPIHIEMIRVKEMATARVFSRMRAEFWPAWLGPNGSQPVSDKEFIHYAGVYREALISNSPGYRFLCLYKILESIPFRRARLSREAKEKGQSARQIPKERVPNTREGLSEFLRDIYPYRWLKEWDPISLGQLSLPEALGKSVQVISDSYLKPIRDRISHALMEDGELGFNINNPQENQQIRKWLPLLRCLARMRLRNEFPDQFIYEMRS